MKKHWCLGGTLLTVGLLLGGCGSSEDAASATDETITTTEEDSTTGAEPTEKAEIVEGELIADNYKQGISSLTEEQVVLNDTSYNFIIKNHKLLPANTASDIQKAKDITDASISSKMLNKNAVPYFEKFATFEGYVISVQEELAADGETTVSVTHVYDDEGQSYQVIMFKGTGDVLEEDRVRFWGVPVGASSFENVSGGATNVQNFVGAHLEKVQ